VRWNEAIKVLSGQKQLSPAGVLLATFSQSPRYQARALDIAQQLLTNSTSPEDFFAVFGNVFEPVTWFNLKWILNADRSVRASEDRLESKSWDKEKNRHEGNLLNEAERAIYHRLNAEIPMFGTKLAPLLKGPRPKDVVLDLNATEFWFSDWKGANLSGADLTFSTLYAVDLDGANLSGITRFLGANFEKSSWWNAATISPQLLDYLAHAYPYNANDVYGSAGRPISPADYEAALMKLKKASPIS
jgi:Pentapeptide repeats (8 copies)